MFFSLFLFFCFFQAGSHLSLLSDIYVAAKCNYMNYNFWHFLTILKIQQLGKYRYISSENIDFITLKSNIDTYPLGYMPLNYGHKKSDIFSFFLHEFKPDHNFAL